MDNLPHVPCFLQRWCALQNLSVPKDKLRKLTPQSESCPQLDWTDRNKPGLKRPEASPEAPRGSVGSVGITAFPCRPWSLQPESRANSVGVNKGEVGSSEQTISTTCSLPKPVVIIVPENKSNIKKCLISVVLELIPAMKPVEGK